MKTWTQIEVEILLDNYNKLPNSELALLIPNKSWNGIYKKAYKLGLRKSAENQFINRSLARKREKSSNWNGGITTNNKGYRCILDSTHHRADKRGYVLEHIYVWEKETGLKVPKGFCIHHLNGDKSDNRIENLSLMLFGAHTKHHHIGAKRSPETRRKISEKARNRNEFSKFVG